MESRNFQLLLAIDALLQEGSVTQAAMRLGISTPAMSHTLARIRDMLGDPLLVRAGRRMVLTPRAEELRPRVRSLVEEATQVLLATTPFEPATLQREFLVYATDQFVSVLGAPIQRSVHAEAPGVSLRYIPNTLDDAQPLRDGKGDLSVCLLGHFPPEFRTRKFFTDRFVSVLRKDHPVLRSRLTLDRWLGLDHIVVSPLGLPSLVDRMLEERGQHRRISAVVPYFAAGLLLAAETDAAITVSVRAALAWARHLPLRLVEVPLPLPTYDLYLLWHPRHDADPANTWLRSLFLRVAEREHCLGADTLPRLPRT